MSQAGLHGDRGPGVDVETNHDYDGIHEFDNPLPRWWLLTFYGAILFSVGYWFYYHTLGVGELPLASYQSELEAAQKEEIAREARLEAEGKGVTEEQLLTLSHDKDAVQRGEQVFKQNCLPCHGERGQGVVGPNLTDAYWLHGSKAKEIYTVVSSGVLDKGMPSWRPVLGASKVKDATAFVLSLKGRNEPGKAPQGISEDGKPAPQ